MQKKIHFIILVLLTFLSCDKESEQLATNDKPFLKDNITGFVQKGPFINGTSVSLLELNIDFSQTGKSFDTQMETNNGSFTIDQIELISGYALFKATGYYFNEVDGANSNSELTLYSFSDITDKDNLNINIVTHLQKDRTFYLIDQDNEYEVAYQQSLLEVLSIFGFEMNNAVNSDQLDILVDSEENAMLLAISIILQGNRSVADLAELLANIVSDIKQDGVLDNQQIRSSLFNQTINLSLQQIRANLKDKFSNTTIPNFEKFIKLFLENYDPFQYSIVKTNASCFNSNDGEIALSIEGGTPPYQYFWSNGFESNVVSNLAPDYYSVTVIDANGFQKEITDIEITEPAKLEVNFTTQSTFIDQTDGAVNIDVFGGTEPYSFDWSNGFTTEDIAGLSLGSYSATITDANNCLIVITAIIKGLFTDPSVSLF